MVRRVHCFVACECVVGELEARECVVNLSEWSGFNATKLTKGRQQTAANSNQFQPKIELSFSLHIGSEQLSL